MRDINHQTGHRILGLVANNEIVYLAVAKLGQSPWRSIWDGRDRIDSPLGKILRGLDVVPSEITVFGATGLHLNTATQVLPLLSAWFPKALVGGLNRRGCRTGKPCGRVVDGKVETWPSRAAAAEATGLSVWTILRMVKRGVWFGEPEPTVVPIHDSLHRGKPCGRLVDGQLETWPDRLAAAKATGLPLRTVYRRLKKGVWFNVPEPTIVPTPDDCHRGRPCGRLVNGVTEKWPSRRAAANATGLNIRTVYTRIKQGLWTSF